MIKTLYHLKHELKCNPNRNIEIANDELLLECVKDPEIGIRRFVYSPSNPGRDTEITYHAYLKPEEVDD